MLWQLLALCLAASQAAGQPVMPSDVQVRAAYLHKFPGFVEWPPQAFAGPDAPIVIAVCGEDELFAELAKLVPGRLVLGRAVKTLRLSPGAAVPADIHVFYASARTLRSNPAAQAAPRRPGVLTVSDGDACMQQGAALCFVEEEGRIRFDASSVAAERSGLKLSARLLGVARQVTEGAP